MNLFFVDHYGLNATFSLKGILHLFFLKKISINGHLDERKDVSGFVFLYWQNIMII